MYHIDIAMLEHTIQVNYKIMVTAKIKNNSRLNFNHPGGYQRLLLQHYRKKICNWNIISLMAMRLRSTESAFDNTRLL